MHVKRDVDTSVQYIRDYATVGGGVPTLPVFKIIHFFHFDFFLSDILPLNLLVVVTPV